MLKDNIRNEYFEWMYKLVCEDRFSNDISYKKLLATLHNTEFTYTIPMDENRASDGIDLRRRFILASSYNEQLTKCLEGPCSVLEMMVGLTVRCEETIMDNPKFGNRTGQWFWGMVNNLGIGAMIDSKFDKDFVDGAIKRFLDREYEPNGKGGLFTIRNCDCDLRDVEIWYQLTWYLDSGIGG